MRRQRIEQKTWPWPYIVGLMLTILVIDVGLHYFPQFPFWVGIGCGIAFCAGLVAGVHIND